jgi:hypothetical protein
MKTREVSVVLNQTNLFQNMDNRLKSLILLGFSSIPIFVWWLAEWPGVMTNDSLLTWSQIRSGKYEQFHTVSYTIFVWVFSLGGSLLSLVSLTQAFLLFYAFYRLLLFCNSQMSKEVALISASCLYWLPYLGSIGNTLWKDIPFTALTLLGLIRIFTFDTQSLRGRAFSITILSLGLSFRHDGVVWAGIFGALLSLVALFNLIAKRKACRDFFLKTGYVFVATVFSVVFSQGLNIVTSASPSEPFFAKLPLIGDIAYVAQSHPNQTPQSVRNDIQQIASGESWDATQDCTTLSGLLFYAGFSKDGTNEYAKQSLGDLKLMLEAGLWNELLAAHLCRARAFIPPPFSAGPSYSYWTASGIAQTGYNEYGLQPNPPFPKLSSFVENWRMSWEKFANKVAWPGLVFTFSLFLLAVNARIYPIDRKKYLYLTLLMASRLFGLVLFTLAQDFRYALIVHLVFLALLITTIFNLHQFLHSKQKTKRGG